MMEGGVKYFGFGRFVCSCIIGDVELVDGVFFKGCESINWCDRCDEFGEEIMYMF